VTLAMAARDTTQANIAAFFAGIPSSAAEPEPDFHVCGAPTRSGGICQKRIPNHHARCHLHDPVATAAPATEGSDHWFLSRSGESGSAAAPGTGETDSSVAPIIGEAGSGVVVSNMLVMSCSIAMLRYEGASRG